MDLTLFKKLLGLISLALFLQSWPVFVFADAWWGKGARDKDWVLRHGGSLIYYEIEGGGDADEYEAILYLEGKKGAGGGNADKAEKGDVIENETGRNSLFDDAINNEYRIDFFRNGEKDKSVDLIARPGEIIEIIFDIDKDLVRKKIARRYAKDQLFVNINSSKWINLKNLDQQGFVFDDPFPSVLSINENEMINFKANIQESDIDYYKVKLFDKNGEIVRGWKKQSESFYFVPQEAIEVAKTLLVRAYNEQGDYVQMSTVLKFQERESENEDEEDSLELSVVESDLELETNKKEIDLKSEEAKDEFEVQEKASMELKKLKNKKLEEIDLIFQDQEDDSRINIEIEKLKNENKIKVFFFGVSLSKVENLLTKLKNKQRQLDRVKALVEEVVIENDQLAVIEEKRKMYEENVNQKIIFVQTKKNTFGLLSWLKNCFS